MQLFSSLRARICFTQIIKNNKNICDSSPTAPLITMITGETARSSGALKLEGRTATRRSSPGVILPRWCEHRPSRVAPSSSCRTFSETNSNSLYIKTDTMDLWNNDGQNMQALT